MSPDFGIQIRTAVPADAGSLASLAGELGYPTTAEAMKLRLERLLGDTRHAIYVAETSSVVGWVHVGMVEFLESGSFAEIFGIVVTEAQRGKRIGAALLDRAEQWARLNGCPRVRIRSNVVRTESHRFYEKQGYVEIKMQKVFDKTL